jgi:iron(III) transport system permease protein
MRRVSIPLVISLVLFVLLLIPVFYLIIGASFFPEIGQPTFTFLQFVTSKNAAVLVSNTLEFSISHAAIAVALAIVYAWLVARTDIPGKRIFELLPLLGLSMPLLVKALAWTFIFDPRVGIANTLLNSLFGTAAPIFNIYSMGGLIFAGAMGAIPIAYLIILPAMKSYDPSLEEASFLVGHRMLKTFTKVTASLILPAIISAFVLLVVSGMDNFDYPFIIGGPANIHVLSTEVYFWAQGRSPPSYGSAGVISILYLLITLVSVGIYLWITRRAYKYVVITGKTSSGSSGIRKLRKWKIPAFIVCSVILLFEFGFPFLAIVFESTTNFFIVGFSKGLRVNFPLWFVNATNLPLFYQSIYDTIAMALITGIGATAFSFILSYTALKSKVKGARLTEYISNIPLAFPGVVYGIALFWTFLLLPGVNLLYGTVWPLVISVLFIRLPVSTRIISGNMVQISNELEEASHVGGATFVRTFGKILVPLMKNGLINSFIYTFVESMRELGAVIILVTPQTAVFTTLILDYYNDNTLSFGIVAAASVMLTGIVVASLIVLSVVQHFWGRQRKIPEPVAVDLIALETAGKGA